MDRRQEEGRTHLPKNLRLTGSDYAGNARANAFCCS
jgi:hypothetical protein